MAFTFSGREVAINLVSFGDLVDAQEKAADTGKAADAMWVMLAKAATYVDDGSLVFPSVEDIRKAPATEAANIMRMSAEVSKRNIPEMEQPTDPS